MLYDEILAEIEALCNDKDLYAERNFSSRMNAIDNLDLYIPAGPDAPVQTSAIFDDAHRLARTLKQELEEINLGMFRRLRTELLHAADKGKFLLDIIPEYVQYNFSDALLQQDSGYDDLDVFVNGLLMHQNLPSETRQREPEMVFYQKTPARIIFHMANRAGFKPGDVFVDLGSGLGQAGILITMLTGISSIGIEFEPAFCHYARSCAKELNVNHADFINMDARYASYSAGTVFFLYTPFGGQMLRDVMDRLRQEAERRAIKLFTYGPCTREVALQGWLKSTGETEKSVSEFGEFTSTR